ncbi:hypothetical protein [Acinetobacter sp.]|uniref:hypothetical protein n=1 Tax=Acinetobacter sp. TaxID=472 RepID=UPI003CFD67A1
MRYSRSPYNAARTHSFMKQLPSWLNKDATGRLFRTLNSLGCESELFTTIRNSFTNSMRPFHMDISQATNIRRIDNLPNTNAFFYGQYGDTIVPLSIVKTERELLDSLPTRIANNNSYIINDCRPFLSLKYIHNIPELKAGGFVAISDGYPTETGNGLYIIDSDFNIVTINAFSRLEQTLDEYHVDEEVVFDTYVTELQNTPFVGTLHIYDVLNLTDGLPTEITSFTLDEKTVTWTGDDDPTGRYAAEYTYPAVHGIRSIQPTYFKWNIGTNDDTSTVTDVVSLPNDTFVYDTNINDPDIKHTISSNSNRKELPILALYTAFDDAGVLNYYVRLNPLDIRSGRYVDVGVTGVHVYKSSWMDLSAPFEINLLEYDSAFIDTALESIQIFDSDGSEMDDVFTKEVDFTTGTVTITDNPDYLGYSLTINIYYRVNINTSNLGIYITTENDSEYMAEDGQNIYYSKANITPLVNNSIVIPQLPDISASCEEEFVSVLYPIQKLGFIEDAIKAAVYLERFNQSLHFKELSGDAIHVHLVGMEPVVQDDETIIYTTDLMRDIQNNKTNFDLPQEEYGIWEYRDMVLIDDHLVLLRTSVPRSDEVNEHFMATKVSDMSIVAPAGSSLSNWTLTINADNTYLGSVEDNRNTFYPGTVLAEPAAFSLQITPNGTITIPYGYLINLDIDGAITQIKIRSSLSLTEPLTLYLDSNGNLYYDTELSRPVVQGSYLKESDPIYGTSMVDFVNLLNRDTELTFLAPQNSVSLTYGPDHTLYFLSYSRTEYEEILNTIWEYKLFYDYALLSKKGDTMTAYVRSMIDNLVIEYDEVENT